MEFASIEKFLEWERKKHGQEKEPGEDKKHVGQEQKNHGECMEIQRVREAQARELAIAEQIRDDHRFAQRLQDEADQELEELPEVEVEDDEVQLLRRNQKRGQGRVDYTRFFT